MSTGTGSTRSILGEPLESHLAEKRSVRPLVSIAIPAYKPGRVFRETLRSCLAQDYPNLEIVVAIDGEDEDVRDAIRDEQDPRLRLLADGSRWGQFANFNRAIDATKGEFIKLFSADDLMSRDCVSAMVAVLEANPGIGLCAARHIAFHSDGEGVVGRELQVPKAFSPGVLVLEPEEARWYTALHGNQLGGPSNVMLRRSTLWRTGGFDPRVGHIGDLAYWVRASRACGLAIMSRPLIGYRVHDNSVTKRDGGLLVRVEEPFSIAEDATMGACFPNALWWERTLRRLASVQSTAGYAAAILRRRPLEGLEALWRMLTAGGPLLVPLTVPLAAWSLLRTSLLRLRTQWPFRDPTVLHPIVLEGLDWDALMDLLDDPGTQDRLIGRGQP